MKFLKFVVVTGVFILSLGVCAMSQAHVPAQGSVERKTIIDGIKALYKATGDSEGKPYRGTITFDVKYIKANGAWAWVYAEPRSTSTRDQFGENSGYLLHAETDGKWKVQELPPPVEDPDDPENLDYPSAKDVVQIRKMHRSAPANIFPVNKNN